MNRAFFFDTYALIEIGKRNPNYDTYRKDVKMIISMLNLLELAYFLFREKKEDEIEEIFSKLSRVAVPYTREILILAAKMKYENKKERLSYIDCIGYLLAKNYGVKFLTGDSKFKNKENVEFVR